MRKIWIVAVVLVLAGAGLGYRYLYHDHRRVEEQDAAYTIGVAPLEQKFLSDAGKANATYADKIIVVSGKITALEPGLRVLTIDGKLSVQYDPTHRAFNVGDAVRVKGRFVGYDDLLGELRMDQAVFLE